MLKHVDHARYLLTLVATVVVVSVGLGQSSMTIYEDSLTGGWQNWSWSSTVDLNNGSPVHSGSQSIAVTAQTWGALSLHHSELDMNLYSTLSFWAHGGSGGGQQLQLVAEHGSSTTGGYPLPPLTANEWQSFDIPLAALGVATVTDLHRFSFQLTSGGANGVFYMDNIELTGTPPPSSVQLSVDASQIQRTADNRWFGVNTAIWDNDLGDTSVERTTTVGLLDEMGTTTLRFPGGSLSDEYHWAKGTTLDNTWQWNTTFAEFTHAATTIGADVFITVNYGTGTPEEAAGWVRHANITNQLGFQYWEIGNENYGTWETDANSLPNHAYTYATRAQQYFVQMKAADPTIKIGVVAVPGEDSYSNGYTDHPAYNPRTGETKYGWTPVLLTTLKALGVTPDFLVHHHYPQWTNPSDPGSSPDDDAGLLQSTSEWANHAADLRLQISDYFGAGGENIELVVTENNSDAGAQGRQSTSLVNGLYYADSLGELMRTEFNAFVWWDLRNGTDAGGYFGPEIYGWRNYGDLGMINGLDTRHPTFYAAKMIKQFVRGGDAVVSTASDYPLLSCHAARRVNGDLSLLVINKSLTTALNADVQITGFVPETNATLHFFGIPQDEAARTNGAIAQQDVATSNFNGADSTFAHEFPPLSMTVLTLSPSAPPQPVLVPLAGATSSEFVVELHGQPGFSYALEKTTNALDWVGVSTNTLTGNTMSITNPITADIPHELWRASWIP